DSGPKIIADIGAALKGVAEGRGGAEPRQLGECHVHPKARRAASIALHTRDELGRQVPGLDQLQVQQLWIYVCDHDARTHVAAPAELEPACASALYQHPLDGSVGLDARTALTG